MPGSEVPGMCHKSVCVCCTMLRCREWGVLRERDVCVHAYVCLLCFTAHSLNGVAAAVACEPCPWSQEYNLQL